VPPNSSVKKIMHENIISVNPYTSIEECGKIMIENDIRRLPVLSNGNCVGIVTMKDILKALLKL
ncbi:MAG: cyclic nucleotide-binding/CBS domain-containing protein, partial [Candidatus Altarchaeaceae archaeon]